MMKSSGSAQIAIECVYCRKEKPPSAYTEAEHVLPQSFGKFKKNFTLIRLVCDECNQFLGDNVELLLARDTLEGQSRADFGLKKARNYKSPGTQESNQDQDC
jgi:hypothetical protein